MGDANDRQVLDELLTKLWGDMGRYRLPKRAPGGRGFPSRGRNYNVEISQAEITILCKEVKKVLKTEPLLLRLEAPVQVCGDVHGQFEDLKYLFWKFGRPHSHQYLFMGDYVDRGENQLETICMLLSLKVAYPTKFHLLRGNHEIRNINMRYGFWGELIARFPGHHGTVFNQFNTVFTYLPIAAVIEGSLFCTHGGLSPNLRTLDQFNELRKPLELVRDTWPYELLWSDPHEEVDGYEENYDRGTSYVFGRQAVEDFLLRNGLTKIARAHQVCQGGFKKFFNFKLITIFSAPNYVGGTNRGAAMKVRKVNGELKFALTTFRYRV